MVSKTYGKIGKPLAKYGDVLNAGARWQKAVVIAVDNGAGLPTNLVAAGYVRPTQVYALLGRTTVNDFTNFGNYKSANLQALITWLNTYQGGNALVPAGETYTANTGSQIVPAGLVSTVETEFSLVTTSASAYKAIIANTKTSSQLLVLATNGATGIRITASGTFTSDYNGSVITALIDY